MPFINFLLQPILLVPLLFWVIQNVSNIIRHKLIPEKDNKGFYIETFKSIGYNLSCIALSIDFGLLSQYKGEIFKFSPNFCTLIIIHLLTFMGSFMDQISYSYLGVKIQESNKWYKTWFWKLSCFIFYIIFLGLGFISIFTIYKTIKLPI